MVVAPGEVPIDRSTVAGWIKSWKKTATAKRPPIEDYIRQQVAKLELGDEMVQKAHYSEDPVTTHIADLIIDDLPSYGVSV